MNRIKKLAHLAQAGNRAPPDRLLAHLGGLCILAMTLVVTCNVILRYVFRSPTSWSLEITGYLTVACIFLPLALTQAENKQIRVDLLRGRLTPRLKSIVDLTISIIALSFFILLTIKSLDMAIFSYQHHLVSNTVARMPLFPSQLVLTVGAFTLCMCFILLIYRQIALLSAKYSNRRST